MPCKFLSNGSDKEMLHVKESCMHVLHTANQLHAMGKHSLLSENNNKKAYLLLLLLR